MTDQSRTSTQNNQTDFLDSDMPSLGEMIVVGLTDIKDGRFREISSDYTVKDHLDYLFGPEPTAD